MILYNNRYLLLNYWLNNCWLLNCLYNRLLNSWKDKKTTLVWSNKKKVQYTSLIYPVWASNFIMSYLLTQRAYHVLQTQENLLVFNMFIVFLGSGQVHKRQLQAHRSVRSDFFRYKCRSRKKKRLIKYISTITVSPLTEEMIPSDNNFI